MMRRSNCELMRRPATAHSTIPILSSATSTTSTADSSPLSEQKRYSLKYAKHVGTLPEMTPASWVDSKRRGVFQYEKFIPHHRKRCVEPMDRTHQNIWWSDTTTKTNRFYTPYWFLNKDLNTLLGRKSSFESGNVDRSEGLSNYELTTDQRFKGANTPAIINLNYEANWNRIIYPRYPNHHFQTRGARKVDPKAVTKSEVFETKSDVAEWWKRLDYLIGVHRAAVGETAERETRDIRVVHAFFTNFHDSMTGFEYQNHHLQLYLKETRPEHLEDLFGIFLEMELNYVNEDYCPRCSLPYNTTQYCGEGVKDTPFKQWRGRYSPHKPWGKEWYDVVAKRAEQLWYRSTEDPWFGNEFHTQKQAETLLHIYCKAQQRGKANDFMIRLRGSLEFLTGRITITPEMQTAYDRLLDTTPHPHLPTESNKVEDGASRYLGDANRVGFSPQQFRIDLELAKFRRMQREEGVIRLPPKEWSIDNHPNTIPMLKVDPTTKHVTNWRSVKKAIEDSFLSSGLTKGSYTSQELREIAYLEARIASMDEVHEVNQAKFQAAKKALGNKGFVFPDDEFYRVFDKSDAALKPFSVTHGKSFNATKFVFADPARVQVTLSGSEFVLDTTEAATTIYGGYAYGQIVELTSLDGDVTKAIIAGVNKEGASDQWELIAINAKDSNDVLRLGTDVNDISKNWKEVTKVGSTSFVPGLDDLRSEQEEFEGTIIGVLDKQLYAQFDDGVATSMGDEKGMKAFWRFNNRSCTHVLKEPPSWNVPFRNDWSEERLASLKKAPWDREEWVSLVPNKYTPKPKQFGLTQHTTQDDFVTKEYKDRLTSKQFFTKPEAFSVIPDRRDNSVKFRGKGESLITHGTPSVDRNELENGWDRVEPVPEWEVEAVEQCIRDISGRRPGNFVKTPKEASSLKLNEQWFKPLEFGWQQRNEEQMLLHPSARELTDPSKLPYGGKLPAHGTTHGMGERIRGVANDFAKGFDLGPNGFSPSAGNYDTLGFQALRANIVGFGSPLVRLFNTKLGTTTEQQWVSQFKTEDPKKLLLSLNEWRMHGKAPSLALIKVLRVYLKDEIDAYNSGVPDSVKKLVLDESVAAENGADSSTKDVWADTDSLKYRQQYQRDYGNLSNSQGSGDQGFLLSRYLTTSLEGVPTNDDGFLNHASQKLSQQFMNAMSKAIGKGIGAEAMRGDGSNTDSGKGQKGAKQLIRSQVLFETLVNELSFSHGEASLVVEKLGENPGKDFVQIMERGKAIDFAMPLNHLLMWKGPSSGGDSRDRQLGGGQQQRGNSITHVNEFHSGVVDVPKIMKKLVAESDGLAMDLQYRARENKKHDILRADFKFAVDGIFGDDVNTDALYDLYCDGGWVPNSADAIAIINRAMQRAARAVQEGKTNEAVKYFTVNNNNKITGVQMHDAKSLPFEFDNVAADKISTRMTFREYNIRTPDESRIRVHVLDTTNANTAASHAYTVVGNAQIFRPPARNAPAEGAPVDILTSLKNKLSEDDKIKAVYSLDKTTALAVLANQLLFRFFPLLPSFYQLTWHYTQQVQGTHKVTTQSAHTQLQRILTSENNTFVERTFRQNAQKYWKSVIDSKGELEGGSVQGAQGRNDGRAKVNIPTKKQDGAEAAGANSGAKQRGVDTTLGAVGGSGGRRGNTDQKPRTPRGSPGANKTGSKTGLNTSGAGRGDGPKK